MPDTAPLLPPHPVHLATLGLLDNEIGVATLGYIVGPPIVPRFPAEATVQEQVWLARVEPWPEWWAIAESCNWLAELDASLYSLEGVLSLYFSRAQVEDRGQLLALIEQVESLVAKVEVVEESAVVQSGDTLGAVEDGAASATVQETVPIGVVVDKPGRGRC